MKESHIEGVATHDDPESCAGAVRLPAKRRLGLALELGSDELLIDDVLYKRRSLLSDSELTQMTEPDLWEPQQTVDKLAQLMRSLLVDLETNVEYVEAEPNYHLARVALGLEESHLPAIQAPPDLEPDDSGTIEKTISTNGDQRNITEAANIGENCAQALRESGASGTVIPGARIYTAAHVLYANVISDDPGGVGWICRNGTVDNSANPCVMPGWGKWRFGGRITNPGPGESQSWASPWVNCGTIAVPWGWSSMADTDDTVTISALDYGRANIGTCVPQGVQERGKPRGCPPGNAAQQESKECRVRRPLYLPSDVIWWQRRLRRHGVSGGYSSAPDQH